MDGSYTNLWHGMKVVDTLVCILCSQVTEKQSVVSVCINLLQTLIIFFTHVERVFMFYPNITACVIKNVSSSSEASVNGD